MAVGDYLQIDLNGGSKAQGEIHLGMIVFLKARLVQTNYDFGVCLTCVCHRTCGIFRENDNHAEAANVGQTCHNFSGQALRSTLGLQQSRKVARSQPLNWLPQTATSGMTPEVAGHNLSCQCDLCFNW